MMSCSVAVSNAPVFSPSFYNSIVIPPSPAETRALNLTHLKSSTQSPSSSPRSPSSPFRFRSQKPPATASATSILKRKRPARLDIPVVAMGYGSPQTPVVEKAELEREGHGYSVYCKKGRKEVMEDRFSAVVDIQGNSKRALFGIFDGHGGAKAAEFAAVNLKNNILDVVERLEKEEVEEAVRHGYLKTDAQFLNEDLRGGSCCVTALIRDNELVVSNAGDCRAVMSRGGVAEALTSDHKPGREDERDRIESSGGYVDLIRGIWRVQGTLAVSRGIGDRHLKQWVIAEPESMKINIAPEHEFLILASDGLWDKVSNQEAVDVARSLCVGVEKPEPMSACKKLVELAISRGTFDDVSVMLIQLGSYINVRQ